MEGEFLILKEYLVLWILGKFKINFGVNLVNGRTPARMLSEE